MRKSDAVEPSRFEDKARQLCRILFLKETEYNIDACLTTIESTYNLGYIEATNKSISNGNDLMVTALKGLLVKP